MFRRICEFLWPLPKFPVPEGPFISKSLVKDFDELMPGEILTLNVRGRKFCVVEREELELIAARAGFAINEKPTVKVGLT